jgi:hypothetical protein
VTIAGAVSHCFFISLFTVLLIRVSFVSVSVADSDPYLYFWPPGSGSVSVSQRYGSGFFCHRAKKVIKTLIPIS